MRILLFTETFVPKVDGIVTVMRLLIDHLTARGIETMVAAPRLGHNPPNIYGQTPVVRPFSVPFPLYPELRLAFPTPRLYQHARRYNPDLIHLIGPATLGTGGMIIAKALRKPVVTSFHLDYVKLAKHHHVHFLVPLAHLGNRINFGLADHTLAPSRLVEQRIHSMGVPPERVMLWRRGVDAERFHPRHASPEMRARLSGGNPQDTLLLYVGRLSQEKRVHELRAILERVPGTRLALLGDGPARRSLEAHFDGLPAHFMGYMTGEELSQAYASADVFVFPSALETFGLVVTEAMAAGLPVVASRVGGVMDVVREGENGYSFDVGDVDTMVEGVQKIVHSRENIARMGQNARALAETQTWDVMMDEVITLYEQIIAAHASRKQKQVSQRQA